MAQPYRPGRGLDSAAVAALYARSKKRGLPDRDENDQTDTLLGNGAKKVMRCGVCTRPVKKDGACQYCPTSITSNIPDSVERRERRHKTRAPALETLDDDTELLKALQCGPDVWRDLSALARKTVKLAYISGGKRAAAKELKLSLRTTEEVRAAETGGCFRKQADTTMNEIHLNGVEAKHSGTAACTASATGDAPVFLRVEEVAFDGMAGTAIDVPYDSVQNPSGNFSVDFWAKVASGGEGNRSPLSSRDMPPPRGYSFLVTSQGYWAFWIGVPEAQAWMKVEGPLALEETWQRITGTYNEAERSIYLFVDEVRYNSTCASTLEPPVLQKLFEPNGRRPLRIGAGANECELSRARFPFYGCVRDIRVYDCALAAPLPRHSQASADESIMNSLQSSDSESESDNESDSDSESESEDLDNREPCEGD